MEIQKNYSDNFNFAFDYVIDNEGKTYTNNPDDHGGPTKFGITMQTLSMWRKMPCSPKDVEDLTLDEAKDIYEAFYWLPLGCDKINNAGVATAVLDYGVNCGVVTSIRTAQRALGVKVDGHIGSETLLAINSPNPKEFLRLFFVLVQSRYISIVLQDPSQIKFLHTWLIRSQRMLALF